MPQLDLAIYSVTLTILGIFGLVLFIALAGSSVVLAYSRLSSLFVLQAIFRVFFVGGIYRFLFFFRLYLNTYYSLLLLIVIRCFSFF